MPAIMSTITEWTRQEEIDSFLAKRGTGLILKHSTRCPISAAAFKELEGFVNSETGVPVYLIRVIESRSVSNEISARLGIQHQSPQAILVRDGAVAWTASHGSITRDALAQAWRGIAKSAPSQGATT